MTTKITEQNVSNLANAGIDWQAVKTSSFTAVAGQGFFVNTASGAVTVTLPSSPTIGDTVAVVDYGGVSATSNKSIILAGNGSKILASSVNKSIVTNEVGVILVFTDSTKGWVINGSYVQAGLVGVPGAPTIGTAAVNGINIDVPFTAPSDNGDAAITRYTATASPGGATANLDQAGSGTITVTGLAADTAFTFTVTATNSIGVSTASAASNSVTTPNPQYIAATGGTVTTVNTNFKVHTFNSDGNFVVSNAGNASGADKIDYLVIAGGGGANDTGGGGAGGMRYSAGTETGPYPYGGSGGVALTAAQQTYPVTVGGGGAAGGAGSNSVFSTITSAGGGAGAHGNNGGNGGSGGGAGYGGGTGGTGNTPPVSPPQGNAGGNAPAPQTSPFRGAGGGGAGQAGGNQPGGNGGNGLINSIASCGATWSGGGGGAGTSGAGGNPGTGGGGAAGSHPAGNGVQGGAGSANRGGGGGSASGLPSRGQGGAGGKGIVIVRYRFQA